jgi:hypothetical protein
MNLLRSQCHRLNERQISFDLPLRFGELKITYQCYALVQSTLIFVETAEQSFVRCRAPKYRS